MPPESRSANSPWACANPGISAPVCDRPAALFYWGVLGFGIRTRCEGTSVGEYSGAGGRYRVGQRVWVYPGTTAQISGVVVEDFGADAGVGGPVLAGQRILAAARRWAVQLSDGQLVFVDGEQLAAFDDAAGLVDRSQE